MKLCKISFFGLKKEGINTSSILEVELTDKNLVVGVNTTGKSRLVSLISGLSKMLLTGHSELQGRLEATFKLSKHPNVSIEIDSTVYDPSLKLRTTILKIGKKSFQQISDNIDRQNETIGNHNKFEEMVNGKPEKDINEYDREVLNDFIHSSKIWAESVRVLRFANFDPLSTDERSTTLVLLREMLPALSNKSSVVKSKIISDIQNVGYEISDLGIEENGIALQLWVKESKSMFPLSQFQLSQGLFRTILLVTLVNYLNEKVGRSMLLVDDFGEGLDYSRSHKLAKLVFESGLSKKIHILATSNDSFIMNSISVRNWIILNRKGGKTFNYSYSKNKKKFTAFEDTGLMNFDLLSSNFLNLKI